ncbi:AAA family ATPase [Paracoccus caeni]|uniref:AAA family ATPase n=1 Tax=Paracoccus caeni TaxID=657651 RepID=A0A934SFY3_9RHOB|nr:AAA family ATPase [Paracoccus caeni]MBK4218165.1 AAA family ATPase [Paracoccus caeni]
MTTRGFLLGKFLPPHTGHVFMCNMAAAMCDELTVLVCSLDSDPIEGSLRYQWMKQLLPHVRVIHHTKNVPQTPEEHPDFWAIWQRICKEAHPEHLDYVFGSEPYVVELAKVLDARPKLIDPERLAFPTSARIILRDPAGNWDMIPDAVRPYFQRRVVLAGAESTGKSTLAAELASALNTRFVPEYGRIFDAYRTEDWQSSSFTEIELGHRAMRQAIAPSAGPILIEDTDELVTRVWQSALTGTMPARARPSDLADLYLLLPTDLPWQDDGTRYQQADKFREAFQQSMKHELIEAGVAWRAISGTGPARLRNAMEAIEQAFAQGTDDEARKTASR